MSPAADRHDAEHVGRLSLYALRALPPDEVPATEAQIAACAGCRQELQALRPTLEAFVAWPTDLLRPSPALWDRLAQRIAVETGNEPVAPSPQRWAEPEWKEVATGIFCKVLATDTERDRVSMLVRLAPGTDYPPHRHDGIEELHMLDGVLIVDDTTYHPGDYRRAEPGTVDHRVWSETGCTCVLVTSFRDAIL
jgi:quercetin dioxygenase-like cupin family protein